MRIDGGFALRAVGLVFVATGLLLLATLLPDSGAPPTSASVTEPTLANGDVMLMPSDVMPRIGRHQAEQVARGEYPINDAPVLNSWLGYFGGPTGGYAGGLVWVVALDPTSIPAYVEGPAPVPGQPRRGTREYRTTRATAVIDATTGETIYFSTVASPVDPLPVPTPSGVIFSPY